MQLDLDLIPNPKAKYKFTSLSVSLSSDLTMHERETYSLLVWLGDVGGLFDGLKVFGLAFVSPVASFMLKSKLTSSIFKQEYPLQTDSGKISKMNNEKKFAKLRVIKSVGYWTCV